MQPADLGTSRPHPVGDVGSAARFRRVGTREIVLSLSLATLIFLVLVPMVFLIWSSVRESGANTPFSPDVPYGLANYIRVLANPSTYGLLATTFVFTAGSLAIGVFMAVVLAWFVERTDIPFRTTIYMIALAPIAMPGVIVSIAWILLLSPNNGLLNHLIRSMLGGDGPGPLNIYTVAGMFFVQGLIIVPTTFLLISPALRIMDPSLEEAAAVAGGNRFAILRRVTLPALMPALGNALIFQFVTVVQAFDVPAVVGLQSGVAVLSTRVYLSASPAVGLPDYGLVSTYSILLLIVSLVPLIWYSRLTRQAARYATVTGKGFRPKIGRLGRWKYPALGLVGIYALISLALPTFIMVWMSIQPFYSLPSGESLGRITFDAYADLFQADEFWTLIRNTSVLGVAAASATTLLSLIIGWMIVRMRGKGAFALDLLSFAPHVIPGIVIAVSALLFYLLLANVMPFPIYGTVAILVIAITTMTLGFGIRAFRSAVLQIQKDLEEAGMVAGASWSAVITQIVVPILRPAILNIWIWTFLVAVTNLTIVLTLYGGSNGVLATAIYHRWDSGRTSSAAAIGVLLMATSIGLTAVVYRFFIRRSRLA